MGFHKAMLLQAKARWTGLLKQHDAADAGPRMHQVETLVDLFQRRDMGDHRVDLDLAIHIPVDDLGHVGAALGPTKGVLRPCRTHRADNPLLCGSRRIRSAFWRNATD